jgi:hypothetical protein
MAAYSTARDACATSAAVVFWGMRKPPPPSLLDELRRKSEALRAEHTAARQPLEKARHDIESQLWTAFRWLDEELKTIFDVIRPEVKHQFKLAELLTIDRPRFDGGFATFRRHGLAVVDGLEHVEVYYRLVAPRPFVLCRYCDPDGLGTAERFREWERKYAAPELAERKVVRNGVFHVRPHITSSIRFEPDYRRQVIEVTLRNIDRFESVQLEFEPARIDVPALEDLVHFILGDSNAFLHRAPLAYVNSRRDQQVGSGT